MEFVALACFLALVVAWLLVPSTSEEVVADVAPAIGLVAAELAA